MNAVATTYSESNCDNYLHNRGRPQLALLWDVDGTLCPNEASQRPAGYQIAQMRGDGRYVKSSELWLNPDHGPKILGLAAELGAENWWATAWRGEANKQIGPFLGLPDFPTLFLEVPSTYPEWKWPHVLARFDGRPLIWFDDEFNESWNASRRDHFLQARGATPTLLHYVDPSVGLRDSDLAAARDWARTQNVTAG